MEDNQAVQTPNTTASSALTSAPVSAEQVNQSATTAIQQPNERLDTWYAGVKDDSLRGYAETKGFTSVDDMIASYKQIDDVGTADKAKNTVILPKDAEDVEGYNNLYKALGRPEKPQDYGIQVPDGQDATLANKMSEEFFNAGLSKQQVEAITGKWNEMTQLAGKESNAKFESNANSDMEDLKRDWGNQSNHNIEMARRGASASGLDKDQISAIEKSIGTKAAMNLFKNYGSASGEHSFNGSESGSNGLMSPEAAKIALSKLDVKNWNADTQEKFERLNRLSMGSKYYA